MKLILDSLSLSRSISPIPFFSHLFWVACRRPTLHPNNWSLILSHPPVFRWLDRFGRNATRIGSNRISLLSFQNNNNSSKKKKEEKEREHSLCLYAAEAAEYIYAICRAIHTHTSRDYNIYGIINSSWLTSIGLHHDVLMPSARQIIDSPSLLVSHHLSLFSILLASAQL